MSRKGQRCFSLNTTRRALGSRVRRTCYYLPVNLPRFGDARTSDDYHFALGALSIDEELIIRNRGGHVEVRGQRYPVSFKCLPLYVPLDVRSDQEAADASLE